MVLMHALLVELVKFLLLTGPRHVPIAKQGKSVLMVSLFVKIVRLGPTVILRAFRPVQIALQESTRLLRELQAVMFVKLVKSAVTMGLMFAWPALLARRQTTGF